jgi:hypothetical protein
VVGIASESPAEFVGQSRVEPAHTGANARATAGDAPSDTVWRTKVVLWRDNEDERTHCLA